MFLLFSSTTTPPPALKGNSTVDSIKNAFLAITSVAIISTRQFRAIAKFSPRHRISFKGKRLSIDITVKDFKKPTVSTASTFLSTAFTLDDSHYLLDRTIPAQSMQNQFDPPPAGIDLGYDAYLFYRRFTEPETKTGLVSSSSHALQHDALQYEDIVVLLGFSGQWTYRSPVDVEPTITTSNQAASGDTGNQQPAYGSALALCVDSWIPHSYASPFQTQHTIQSMQVVGDSSAMNSIAQTSVPSLSPTASNWIQIHVSTSNPPANGSPPTMLSPRRRGRGRPRSSQQGETKSVSVIEIDSDGDHDMPSNDELKRTPGINTKATAKKANQPKDEMERRIKIRRMQNRRNQAACRKRKKYQKELQERAAWLEVVNRNLRTELEGLNTQCTSQAPSLERDAQVTSVLYPGGTLPPNRSL